MQPVSTRNRDSTPSVFIDPLFSFMARAVAERMWAVDQGSSVSPLLFPLFLGYQLPTHCVPGTALACGGHGDRAPALPWGPLLPLPAVWARLLGRWPQGYVRSTWMRRWRTTARRSGVPQVTPDFFIHHCDLGPLTKVQTSASPLKKGLIMQG